MKMQPYFLWPYQLMRVQMSCAKTAIGTPKPPSDVNYAFAAVWTPGERVLRR